MGQKINKIVLAKLFKFSFKKEYSLKFSKNLLEQSGFFLWYHFYAKHLVLHGKWSSLYIAGKNTLQS